ncbi:MAG: M56 family metallopeptidase [Sphingobacteriales bacterium]|nr:M56 family metallopeptidase [Sphingobacteriales bacterium]
MQLLNQSAFLQSLGWAIANSLWQMAALWLCYQLFFGINKKASSSAKNLSATVLLFAGTAWFLVGFISKYNNLQNELVVILQGDNLQNKESLQGFVVNSNSFYTFINSAYTFIEKYLPYLSSAYLLVFCFLFIRLLYAWYQCRIIKTSGLQPIDTGWTNHLEQLTLQAGIGRKVSLWLSERIDVPATLGFIKPIILLPIASLNQLTTEQVETILLHELAHIKRNDYIINLFVAIAETILFFNPFAVLLSAQLKRERENSCDDFVLHFRNQPETYAQALLVLEQNRVYTQSLVLKATGNEGQLLHRVKRILNVPSKQFNYRQKLIAFLITAGLLSCLAWIKPANHQQLSAKNSLDKNDIVAKEKGNNKIVLSPSIIEKRPNGDLMLFDAKKKNSLLVKISKDKIRLVDENNNIDINADDLEWEKLKQLKDEALLANDESTIEIPANPDEVQAFRQRVSDKELNNFSYVAPAIMPKIKAQAELIRKQFNSKEHQLEMKRAMEAMHQLNLSKEWENLPTKEDWDKMQQELSRELSKLDLQVKLNNLTQVKLDSVLSQFEFKFSKQKINFDAVRMKKEQRIRQIIQLKEMADAYKEAELMRTQSNQEENADAAIENDDMVIIAPNTDKKTKLSFFTAPPGKQFNKKSPHKVKRPCVIVSL